MRKNPKVFIIILNWNGAQDTIECLDSLRKVEYDNFDVLVIDNDSKGNDANEITNIHGDWIKLIKNNKNDGFAEGNNIGMRHALTLGADFVLLLNNDTTVAPDFLSNMVNVANSDLSIGLVTPTIYFYSQPQKIQDQGRKIGWYGPPGSVVRMSNPSIERVDIELALGTSLLVKKSVIEQIGFLCKDYFYQVEDTDYCARTIKAGFKVVCAPKASIWHKGSVSLNKVPSEKLGYFTRNRFMFRAKHATNLQLVVFTLWFFMIEAPINTFYYLWKFKSINPIKGLLWGTREGMKCLLKKAGFANV